MTSKNYRAPLLHEIKLCASSDSPRLIQTGVTGRTCSIGVKIGYFLSCVTLKFDGWPIGHLFYVASSFVHHFIVIGEFKLNRPETFNSVQNRRTFLSRVTLKFDGWPWKIIEHLFHGTSNCVYHFVAIREFKLELQSGNTQFGSKSTIFLAVWPWNMTDDLEKQ